MNIRIIEGPIGFQTAILGARASRKSYNKSDSYEENNKFILGKKDIKLLSTLIKNGDEHAKGIRSINVWVEISAPRYFWQEFDTYHIGNVDLGSESTIYDKLGQLTKQDFAYNIANTDLHFLNSFTNINKKEFKKILPEGFIQKRYNMISYQTLRRIYLQRRKHYLDEWHVFCDFIKILPYSEELITVGV